MTPVARWALGIGVLVLAVIVALLPRVGADDEGDTADLADARELATLQDCPQARDGATGPAALRGVRALCLADGQRIDVGAALAGRTTLVNIWATWCTPCREELPVLAGYAQSDGAVDVLLVQVASGTRDGLEMLADLGVRLPSLHDGPGAGGPVRAALRVPPVLPASYLVTAEGEVIFIDNPRLLTSVEEIHSTVGGLTEEES